MLSLAQRRRPKTPFHAAKPAAATLSRSISHGSALSLTPVEHLVQQHALTQTQTQARFLKSVDSLLSKRSVISLSQLTQFETQLSAQSVASLVLHYGEASVRGMHAPLPLPPGYVQSESNEAVVTADSAAGTTVSVTVGGKQRGQALKQWVGTLTTRAMALLSKKSSVSKDKSLKASQQQTRESQQPQPRCASTAEQLSIPLHHPRPQRPLLSAALFAESMASLLNPFDDSLDGFSKIWRDGDGQRYLCLEQIFPSQQQLDAFWSLRSEAMRYGRVVPVQVRQVMQRCRQKAVGEELWTVDARKRIWRIERLC